MLYAVCGSHIPLQHFFFLHPLYYPRTTLALPPSINSNSDPGSDSRPSSPLPTTARDFIFIARRSQHFLLSLTDVEMYVPTHAARRSQQLILLLFCVFAKKVKSHHGGNRTQGQTIVVFDGNH